MDFSWREIVTALGVAIAGIGGSVPIVNLIAARWDKRKERIKADKDASITESAEVRGLALEEKKTALAEWVEVAQNYKQELIDERKYSDRLESDIAEMKLAMDNCIKRHRLVLGEIEAAMKNIRVAQIDNAVVEIIEAKIAQVRGIIARAQETG